MAKSVPYRGDVTRWLAGLMPDLVVGLMVAPEEGGWNDDPNVPGSYYQGYTVISPITTPQPSGSLGDPSDVWTLPYAIAYYGVNHDQIEGQGDRVRRILSEVRPQAILLYGEPWKVMSVQVTSLGGIDTDRGPNPDELNVKDTVEVRISKEQ